MNLVEIKNLSKIFDTTNGLSQVTLDIPRGQVIGLLGKNGSGKTTLFNCLVDFYKASEGEIRVEGISSLDPKVRSKISYMPAFEWLPSSWQVGKICRQYQDLFEDFDFRKSMELLLEVGISTDKKFGNLSTGMQAMVKLILTISRKVPLYLLDEPFANMDFVTREDFCKILLKEFSEESTFIISTHILEEIEMLLERVIFLHEGRIVGDILVEEHRERTSQSITEFYREVAR